MASHSDDTEITLGTGKLLGLFFLLVMVCGVFFAIGYSVGKSSAKEQALNDQAANAAAEAASVPDSRKPSAVVAIKAPSPGEAQPAEAKSSDLTFYKSVQQDQPNTKLTDKPSDPLPATTTKVTNVAATPQAIITAAAKPPASEGSPTTASADHGAYMVQIAAVSKQEDAAALAGALKKKSYDVFVVTSPTGADNLFHVQVGPFASLQEADAMKAKLIGDGYNAFVRR
jgi:cell division septation protein DedD